MIEWFACSAHEYHYDTDGMSAKNIIAYIMRGDKRIAEILGIELKKS